MSCPICWSFCLWPPFQTGWVSVGLVWVHYFLAWVLRTGWLSSNATVKWSWRGRLIHFRSQMLRGPWCLVSIQICCLFRWKKKQTITFFWLVCCSDCDALYWVASTHKFESYPTSALYVSTIAIQRQDLRQDADISKSFWTLDPGIEKGHLLCLFLLNWNCPETYFFWPWAQTALCSCRLPTISWVGNVQSDAYSTSPSNLLLL